MQPTTVWPVFQLPLLLILLGFARDLQQQQQQRQQ